MRPNTMAMIEKTLLVLCGAGASFPPEYAGGGGG